MMVEDISPDLDDKYWAYLITETTALALLK